MALFGLVFVAVALALVGVGLAIGFILAVAFAALIALGILSSSTLIGLMTRRPRAALRAFLIQGAVLAGGMFGALCAMLLYAAFATFGGDGSVLVYGALAGGVVGLGFALLVELAAVRVVEVAVSVLASRKGVTRA